MCVQRIHFYPILVNINDIDTTHIEQNEMKINLMRFNELNVVNIKKAL